MAAGDRAGHRDRVQHRQGQRRGVGAGDRPRHRRRRTGSCPEGCRGCRRRSRSGRPGPAQWHLPPRLGRCLRGRRRRADRPASRGKLVDNAIRFAPTGTAVTVGLALSDDEAVVTVADHGPGIAAEEQHRAFERFWRGRPDGRGTGLGLPIARQVALAHGGDLTLDSPGPTGDGCEFHFRLRRRSVRDRRGGAHETAERALTLLKERD
ncbi:MAG: sensor histidine kinase [Egibacteraceae bacterium]